MKSLNILFMGTPDFALPSLDLLHLSSHRLTAVVAPPDRPAGRGRKVRFAPVKEWASKHRVEIAQPQKMNEESFIAWLKQKQPDLIVTAAFGKLLPSAVLELPPLGCINLHASYLPAYRGAAPIHRAIMEGAEYTGVTVIELTGEMDAGDIIIQEKEQISPFDTAGMLHDRLARRGASLLLKAVDLLASGNAKPVPQDPAKVSFAPPLRPEEERIDWCRPSLEIYNLVRGLHPRPGAYTTCKGRRLKVWSANRPDKSTGESPGRTPGTVLAVRESSMTVATGDGSLDLLELQPAGKKPMDAGSFCCGYRVEPGDHLDGER